MDQPKKIVKKINDGMDRQDILCTTYQMRNFYRQFADGFFSILDVMNYIQHHQVVKLAKPHTRILDLCCGRGLLLPMLRYYAKDITSYMGVDIEPKNAIFTEQIVTNNRPLPDDYYPFDVSFIHSNVGDLSQLYNERFDLIVYTSSIEHMHPAAGKQSLVEARKIITPSGLMFLTCPNTPEDRDGYNTQYKAHVYEWKLSELEQALHNTGWQVKAKWGLLYNKKELESQLDRLGLGELLRRLEQFIPSEWLIPVLSPLVYHNAKEIGLMVTPNTDEGF